jgi:transposase
MTRRSKVKLWESYNWLRKKYVTDGLNEFEIAELAGTSQSTINRALRKHGLKK